jgi:hypothetical protein
MANLPATVRTRAIKGRALRLVAFLWQTPLKKQGGRVLRWLEQADLFLYLAPLFMVLLVWGTLAQSTLDPFQAQAQYFNTFLAWGSGVFPLPGGMALLGLMLAGLAIKLARPSLWVWPKTGVTLAHAGAFLLILGGFLTGLWTQEGTVTLMPRVPAAVYQQNSLPGKETRLPFTLTLLQATQQNHPGTPVPRSYESRLRLEDGPASWESTIRMNAPLRYRGYSFYQTVFLGQNAEEGLVLSVAKNPGWLVPYLAGLVICVGILLSLSARGPRKKMKGKA